ncbi:hypothetical protein ZIOFF_024782 [Zingiber officinale]|uniref:ADP,ATP carrier protein n=1 Tax=Zingiber officinale TaxID=94328 RepID=A0A8J5GYT8_ZINOF|nr:hypothetical protein ZIOFF_024782 [Zingiber officinale]
MPIFPNPSHALSFYSSSHVLSIQLLSSKPLSGKLLSANLLSSEFLHLFGLRRWKAVWRMEKKQGFFSVLREEVARGLSPSRSRGRPRLESLRRSTLPVAKLFLFSRWWKRRGIAGELAVPRSGSLMPLMEGPEHAAGEDTKKERGWGQWVKDQLSRAPSASPSASSFRRSDLRMLLGIMATPLAPIHACSIDPLPHLNIKVCNFTACISSRLPLLRKLKNSIYWVDGWAISLKGMMSIVVLLGLVISAIYWGVNKSVVNDPSLPRSNRKKKVKKLKLGMNESLKVLLSSRYVRDLATLVVAYGISINLVEVTWKSKLKAQHLQIAVESTQGLEYLHTACKPPIIHRDVKTVNILLSERFEAKIADFGISKTLSEANPHILTVVMGTAGYLDPEYHVTSQLSSKSDVYSFGVVILELVTGQAPIVTSADKAHISVWVRQRLTQGNVEDVVDPRLHSEYDVNSVWKCIDTALGCLARAAQARPTMGNVVAQLKSSLELEY